MENKEIVNIGKIKIGKNQPLVFMAGPCSVESSSQAKKIEKAVLKAGAQIYRGGSFKLRTNPNTFQGLGSKALDILFELSMPTISEITAISQIKEFVEKVDIIQVGTRSMYNYELLKELGKINKPILLKRAFAATIDEWLNAAQYILKNGNDNIILCERGIRTFDDKFRFTLDLSAISYIKKNTNFPIIVDPSHSSGSRRYVKDLALASIAAGADGLLIEVNDDLDKAISDGKQAISSKELKEIIAKANQIKKIVK